MLQLTLDPARECRVLCLGAHSDDIEIGCGGTMLRLLAEHPRLHVRWEVFSASEHRRKEAEAAAALFLKGAASATVRVHSFRDGFFPYVGGEIKERFEQIKAEFSPDLVFTHFRNDRHQDHRQISDLTWNTFRSHMVLEYEIPKYDGDLGTPNIFMPLDEATCRRKVAYLFEAFRSQQDKQWFTDETFLALLRLRGIEAGEATRYAEAFYGRKLIVWPTPAAARS
jgi:LmbE family N-acetylglucosaminyl deacetylase